MHTHVQTHKLAQIGSITCVNWILEAAAVYERGEEFTHDTLQVVSCFMRFHAPANADSQRVEFSVRSDLSDGTLRRAVALVRPADREGLRFGEVEQVR
jgi:hypothetical protein